MQQPEALLELEDPQGTASSCEGDMLGDPGCVPGVVVWVSEDPGCIPAVVALASEVLVQSEGAPACFSGSLVPSVSLLVPPGSQAVPLQSPCWSWAQAVSLGPFSPSADLALCWASPSTRVAL